MNVTFWYFEKNKIQKFIIKAFITVQSICAEANIYFTGLVFFLLLLFYCLFHLWGFTNTVLHNLLRLSFSFHHFQITAHIPAFSVMMGCWDGKLTSSLSHMFLSSACCWRISSPRKFWFITFVFSSSAYQPKLTVK